MPNVIIDGTNYHYSAGMPDGGEAKQAVLFVHGAGGSHKHWVHQVSILGRRYMVMAVDLPGHGQSGGTARDSVEAYSDFIYRFAERLLGFPFFLGGHSMGGAIALDFAINYPGRLAGLILVGTGARLRVLPDLMELVDRGGIPENLAALMYRPGTAETVIQMAKEDIKRVGPLVFRSDFKACDKFDHMRRLGEIEVPALVLTGDKDVMTPLKYGKFLTDNIKKASFEIIEDAGHMPMLEQPGAVNDSIIEFIEKNAVS